MLPRLRENISDKQDKFIRYNKHTKRAGRKKKILDKVKK